MGARRPQRDLGRDRGPRGWSTHAPRVQHAVWPGSLGSRASCASSDGELTGVRGWTGGPSVGTRKQDGSLEKPQRTGSRSGRTDGKWQRGDGRLPSLLPRPLPPGPPCCVPLWSTGTPGSSPAGPEVHQLAPRVQGGVQAEGSPALLMSQRSGGRRQHPPLLTRRSVRLMGSTVFVTRHSDTQ